MNESTSRQQEIAALAALGLSNGEIASALRVTPGVVRAELEALYRQAQPRSRGAGEIAAFTKEDTRCLTKP